MIIEAFNYNRTNNKLVVLDQTKLPVELDYFQVESCQDGFRVIRDMVVRGAPCIAAVGCLSLIIHLNKLKASGELDISISEFRQIFEIQAELLLKSRSTAVNLSKAIAKLRKFVEDDRQNSRQPCDLVNDLTDFCETAISTGLEANKSLARFGFLEIWRKTKTRLLNILTHCNTGSLATVGYGTALGVIRSIHESGLLRRAYCTETRPYNQGSRLTAWELEQENIPATLISDNMVAYLMATKKIHAVVVGADRVVANGDTANKIGTLQIAVTAKHYGVPFYVAAPSQSIDLSSTSGGCIEIEERPADELRKFGSKVQLAPETIDVWNPCFDITPSNLISGIITEFGVCKPHKVIQFLTDTTNKTYPGDALF